MSNLLDFRNMDGLDNGLILNGYGLVSLFVSLCASLPMCDALLIIILFIIVVC